MAKHCKNYCGLACIDGSCPNAQYEAADERYGYGIAEDMGRKRLTVRTAINTKAVQIV